MRDFSKVSPSLWHSERFNGLKSDDARYAYLYVLTSEHQTSAGCYHLPDAYAAADLRWSLERYQRARRELTEAELIRFDEANSVLMVTRWLKFNPPMNDKHLKGIRHSLDRLPSQEIWSAASTELDDFLVALNSKPEHGDTKEATGRKSGNSWASWKPRVA